MPISPALSPSALDQTAPDSSPLLVSRLRSPKLRHFLSATLFALMGLGCDDPTATSEGAGCERLSAPCPEGTTCQVDAVGNAFCAPEEVEPPLSTGGVSAGITSGGEASSGEQSVSGEAGGDASGGIESPGGDAGGDTGGTTAGSLGGENAGVEAGSIGGEGSPVTCDTFEIALKPSLQGTPQVMLVVDRSYSMIDREDRWTPALRAISQVTRALEESVAFGLTLFPDPLGRQGDPAELAQCISWGRNEFLCSEDMRACVPGQVFVEAEINTSLEIRETLNNQPPQPNQGTPTYSALRAAAEALNTSSNPAADKVIILVTDGLPGCNNELDPSRCDCLLTNLPLLCELDRFATMCLDDQRVINEIAELASQGIKTLVVGMTIGLPSEGACTSDGTCPFGGQACQDNSCVNLAPSVLSEMARAGGAPQGDYFNVQDVATIEAQITRATASIAPCVFDISALPADLYERLVVYVDGQVVMSDPNRMNGWWAESGSLEFFGPACDALRDGLSHRIAARCE